MKILNLEGRVIKEIEGDTLRGANLWKVDLERANLKGADLRGTIYCPSIVLYYWTFGLIK